MLHTSLCDLLRLEVPIIQSSQGARATPELAAAVSNAGAMGSLAAALRTPAALRAQVRRVRELTDRPFMVTLPPHPFSVEAFEISRSESAPVVSYAYGDSHDLPRRAHDAGMRFVQVVDTVQQAREAAIRGADAIVALEPSMECAVGDQTHLCLLLHAVRAVAPLPVIATGGHGDGRGFAAALLLGAKGVAFDPRLPASGKVEDVIQKMLADTVLHLLGARSFVRPIGSAPRPVPGLQSEGRARRQDRQRSASSR